MEVKTVCIFPLQEISYKIFLLQLSNSNLKRGHYKPTHQRGSLCSLLGTLNVYAQVFQASWQITMCSITKEWKKKYRRTIQREIWAEYYDQNRREDGHLTYQ